MDVNTAQMVARVKTLTASLLKSRTPSHLSETDSWVQRWSTDSSEPRAKVVINPAGSGKTFSLLNICAEGGWPKIEKGWVRKSMDRLRNQSVTTKKKNKAFVVGAAYFFQVADTSLRACILSISTQLSNLIADMEVPQSAFLITDNTTLFNAVVVSPLAKVKTPEKGVMIVIDALDTMESAEDREAFLGIFLNWNALTPSWLGLLTTSRHFQDESIPENQLFHARTHHQIDTVLQPYMVGSKWSHTGSRIRIAISIVGNISKDYLPVVGVLRSRLPNSPQEMTSGKVYRLIQGPFPELDESFRKDLTRFLVHVGRDAYETVLSFLVVARAPVPNEMFAKFLEFNGLSAGFFQDLQRIVGVRLIRRRLLKRIPGVTLPHESMASFLLSNRANELRVRASHGHNVMIDFLENEKHCSFAQEHLMYHLCQVRQWDKVNKYMLDFNWVCGLHASVCAKDLLRYYANKDISDSQVMDVVYALGDLYRTDRVKTALTLLARIPDETHPIHQSRKLGSCCDHFLPCASFSFPDTLPYLRSIRFRIPFPQLELDSMLIAVHENLIVAESANGVKVYDIASGEVQEYLDESDDSPSFIRRPPPAFHEGTLAICWNRGVGKLSLWEFSSRKYKAEVDTGLGGISHLTMDDKNIIAVDPGSTRYSSNPRRDPSLCIFDRHALSVRHVLPLNSTCFCTAIYEGVLACAFNDTVCFINTETGRWKEEILHTLARVIAMNQDFVATTYLVDGGRQPVKVWSRDSLQLLFEFASAAASLSFQGANLLVTDRHVFDCRTGECVAVLPTCGVAVCDGRFLLQHDTASYCYAVYDFEEFLSQAPLQENESVFHSLCLSDVSIDNDKIVAVDNSSSRITVWDKESGKPVLSFGEATWVSIKGDIVASCLWTGSVRVWDANSGACLHVLFEPDNNNFHYRIRPTPKPVVIDEEVVVASCCDGRVRVWSAVSGEVLHVLEGQELVSVVAIAGDYIACQSPGIVRVWSKTSGECLHEFNFNERRLLSFAIQEGNLYLGYDRTLVVKDLQSFQTSQSIRVSDLSSLAVSDDMLVGASNNAILSWRLREDGSVVEESASCVLEFPSNCGPAPVAISTDDDGTQRIITSGFSSQFSPTEIDKPPVVLVKKKPIDTC